MERSWSFSHTSGSRIRLAILFDRSSPPWPPSGSGRSPPQWSCSDPERSSRRPARSSSSGQEFPHESRQFLGLLAVKEMGPATDRDQSTARQLGEDLFGLLRSQHASLAPHDQDRKSVV